MGLESLKSPPELIDYWFLVVFKKHVREFSCGFQYYRTFHIDTKRDVLYVGAMDRLYRLNLNNVNKSRCDSLGRTTSSSTSVIDERNLGKPSQIFLQIKIFQSSLRSI
ncbi:hypothetical protein TNCT_243521 [Trichonephila clavata]|uniref:Uncharacterized protein n=1 Tax=Trichonephila clavata TaxID=2740835 RepID=A0A8X6LE05_TRICU|nr:hypothetical protein TNCT_243521 [Trichonephila clavata]